MADVVWRPDAPEYLDDAIDYIRQFDLPAADQVGTKLIHLGASLTDFPRRGRPAANDTRELVTVPPYILTYRVVDDTVYILPIRPGARRPID